MKTLSLSPRVIAAAAGAVLALMVPSAPACAKPSRVTEAFIANDVVALEALSRSAPDAQRRALAAGAVLALRHQDDAALEMLEPVARSTTRADVRATAYLALAGVYLREGRYRACDRALGSAAKLSSRWVTAADRQTMAFAHALADVKPMRLTQAASGSLPITRDKAGLRRIAVQIDDRQVDAVIDTGAAFSTLSTSAAGRLGVRLLSPSVSVGSSTEQAVVTRLGVADRLRVGDAVLTDVVFIVLPDSALTFANGAYRIDAIVGLPVFIALGRIEVGNSGFVYGTASDRAAGRAPRREPDMLLSGLQPLILTRVPGANDPLRMVLDTGSNVTLFNHNLTVDAPALLAGLDQHAFRLGGAGGVKIDRKALRLPATTLIIGGRHFALKDVSVTSSAKPGSDGVIGQDVLGQGSRMTLDFATMRFAIENR